MKANQIAEFNNKVNALRERVKKLEKADKREIKLDNRFRSQAQDIQLLKGKFDHLESEHTELKALNAKMLESITAAYGWMRNYQPFLDLVLSAAGDQAKLTEVLKGKGEEKKDDEQKPGPDGPTESN